MKLDSLHDVFAAQIGDLRSAEKQLVDALPKMAEAASDDGAPQAFQTHLEETREHLERLDDIIARAGSRPGETCKAMKGLIAEGEEIIGATAIRSRRMRR